MIVVVRRRFTTKNERAQRMAQRDVVIAHNKGLLGKHMYTEDVTGKKTGDKNGLYISPKKLRGKI